MLTNERGPVCRERTIANLSLLSQLKPLIPCGVSTDVRLFVLSCPLHYQAEHRANRLTGRHWLTFAFRLVEQGKEPHLYTRDTLERTSGENQLANGKFQAISVRLSLSLDRYGDDGHPDVFAKS